MEVLSKFFHWFYGLEVWLTGCHWRGSKGLDRRKINGTSDRYAPDSEGPGVTTSKDTAKYATLAFVPEFDKDEIRMWWDESVQKFPKS